MSVIVVKVSLGYAVILFDGRKSRVMARDGEGSTAYSWSHCSVSAAFSMKQLLLFSLCESNRS